MYACDLSGVEVCDRLTCELTIKLKHPEVFFISNKTQEGGGGAKSAPNSPN